MKIEKKLELFTRITMSEIEEKRRVATRESNEKFKNDVESAVRAAEKQARERIVNEQYSVGKLKNKQTVTAATEAKRALIALRERLTDELFKDIEDDLRNFAASGEYAGYLLDLLQKKTEGGYYAYVTVTQRDMALAEPIKRRFGLTAEAAEEDFIGGFRLISEDRRASEDMTFLWKLNEARENFSILASGQK
ncbi:MAG: V-type ATP synthase subunit E [Clostridiales bacterium]|jgi:vacuolar-type H+-ATPase subunit E/Vma4|nr:V-type ATP synthase subunit E [Clostridiales bacterium]